tara:strand:- start:4353 stop:4679 length:327 start_codon:yes stop_codon:yes gene_type:complete
MSDKKDKKSELEPMHIVLIGVGILLVVLVVLYVLRELLPEMIRSPFIEFHKLIYGSDTGSSEPLVYNSENIPVAPVAPQPSVPTAIVPVEDASSNRNLNVGGSRFKRK